MQQQADNLREEGEELFQLLMSLDDGDWERPTPFKGWTVNDVVGHLHGGDWAVVLSMTDPDAYALFKQARQEALDRGDEDARNRLGPELASGRKLMAQWYEYFQEMCRQVAAADPKARIQWSGPDMSVRMAATARQMETWAHGQDIYDLLRRPRTATDRLKNIAVLGVKTFGWTFRNRGLPVPPDMPTVTLTAPSGTIWDFPGAEGAEGRVAGSAVEFCHVVTQGRNVADTALAVRGDAAIRWMEIAQCFAGPPRDPPAPGERAWQ
jgi:uncharacterized protein (TIGR03084 family)